MGALSHSGNHLILSNRYALLECLAVSGAGKIYRGRDLEQVKHQGLESRILIHVLPAMTPALPLDALFQQITATCQRIAAPWILAPLAYGQDGDLAYVVMQSPDTWGLHSLISQAGSRNPFYQSAMQRINPLVKQHYLDAHVDPALLLCVSSEDIYLLATALSPVVQMLQSPATQRRSMIPRKPLGKTAATGSLFALFAIFSAFAGNAILDGNTAGQAITSPLAQTAPPPEKLLLASLPQTETSVILPTKQDYTVSAAQDASVSLAAPQPVSTPKPAPKQALKPLSTPEPAPQPVADLLR